MTSMMIPIFSGVILSKKKIVFLTGTRADFGKIKPLISILQDKEAFETHIFVTGMHMNRVYGYTAQEVHKSGFKNIFEFINHDKSSQMDLALSKTIEGFSYYIREINPDLIVVHGDRVEAMAGAIVGSLNNILVAHIEGGELSGTVDELIRHAVSKMSHLHMVSNEEAKKRLIQLGEKRESIFVIGSPDLDVMNSATLPSIARVKEYYEIPFEEYAILMYHPVTTELEQLSEDIKSVVDAVLESHLNYVVIYPNNDSGSHVILKEYQRFEGVARIRLFPSLRFEKFLTLMDHALFILGNSSAGIREAPYYALPSIDIGSRQNNRYQSESVIHVNTSTQEICHAIEKVKEREYCVQKELHFGDGKSAQRFLEILSEASFWKTAHQKQFQDMVI